MATVKKGAKTTQDAPKSTGKKASKPRILKAVEEDEESRLVFFEGEADKLFFEPIRDRFNSHGDRVGTTPGKKIDFQGVGITRGYDMNNKRDAAYVEAVREWLDSDDPTVDKYNIREVEPTAPHPPFAGWSRLSRVAIEEIVLANLGDDHDDNVRWLKECARYEAANENRKEIIALLDGAMTSEAGSSDSFEAEVNIKG